MDGAIKDGILKLLSEHRTMTLATNRPDGWPQATTVGYASEGLILYFLCGLESQKATNLARDDRVSLTIDDDKPAVMSITGLSMAAHASVIDDPAEALRVLTLIGSSYPEATDTSFPLKMPAPSEVRLFKVTPTVISLLDYAKGFGHSDLVTC